MEPDLSLRCISKPKSSRLLSFLRRLCSDASSHAQRQTNLSGHTAPVAGNHSLVLYLDEPHRTLAAQSGGTPVLPAIPGLPAVAAGSAAVVIIAYTIDAIPGDKTAGDGSCPACDGLINAYQKEKRRSRPHSRRPRTKKVTLSQEDRGIPQLRKQRQKVGNNIRTLPKR